MVKLNPNEICDYLASRIDSDYRLVKFKGCLFNAVNNELISTFLYEERIKNKISGMKPQIDQEFKSIVGIPNLTYLFLYKQCYMDAGRLELLVKEFLRKNFSFLTLDLEDDDLAVSKGDDGFTVKLYLQKQAATYIKGSKIFSNFVEELFENNFSMFNFIFEERAGEDEKELTLEDIEKYAENKIALNRSDKVDKVCKISDREYLLGAPIKERPIKIEFLKLCPEDQIIAGTISFFTKREYIKKKTFLNEKSEEITTEKPMPYWTFVIDDKNKKQSCVYFPSGRTDESIQKNILKMEKLGDGTTVCVIGTNSERNGRVNFNIRGISTCKLD